MKPPYMINDYLKIIINQIQEQGFAVHLLFYAKPLFNYENP